MLKTFQYRIKDGSRTRHLKRAARAVNWVWAFCNDTQKQALKWGRAWLSNYDLHKLTAGASRELGLHSQSVQAVCDRYVESRRARNRAFLRYRGRKHLGWVPFKASGIRHDGDRFIYCGRAYRVWYSRPLEGRIKCGSFSQDAQGHWFLNLTCQVDLPERETGTKELGIDLGLKDFAAFFDEAQENVEAQRFYRDLEPDLACAQRAHKKRRVKALHATIAHRRKDFLHKLSTSLLRVYGLICIGKVSSSGLAQTRMAKSVLDAGWSLFRHLCGYKAIAHRAYVIETDEDFSTQDCNACGARTGPKGLSGLGIREWTCPQCGTHHQRDRNAARNILRRGRATLAGGIPILPVPGTAANR